MKNEKKVCKLKKNSKYSYSVTLPKEIIEKYNWREHQKLSIVDKGRGKVEISDLRK